MESNIAALDLALKQLHTAIANAASERHCLSLWSRFVRLRDGRCCVACNSPRGLSAHHVVRKSFLKEAQLQTGNGITLCAKCHKSPHEFFNRRPDLRIPMDAEGGEKIDLLTSYFFLLVDDAKTRGLLRDDYYYLSEQVLMRFKMFQGFEPTTLFPGSRIEQAYLIWRQTPRHPLNAILEANGLPPLGQFVQTREIELFYLE